MSLENWSGEPAGIPLSDINWDLTFSENPEKPFVNDPAQRFYARFPEKVDARLYGRESVEDWWGRAWRDLPLQVLREVFSEDEILRMVHGSLVTSRAGDELREEDLGRVALKVRNSMWRWGMHSDWNDFVRYYKGLGRFDFGVDGFEARLDHTTGYNPKGLVLHHRNWDQGCSLFIDGVFCYIVYRKGKPVMVIGFSFSREGVLLQQVQLLQKKGNRWLFKLPKHFFDHVVERFTECFEGSRIFLVDGKSALDALARSYPAGTFDQNYDDPTKARIQALYDRPLVRLQRGDRVRVNRVEFHQLVAA
jgi:hypothetical protein